MSTVQSVTTETAQEDTQRHTREMIDYCESHPAITTVRYYAGSQGLYLYVTDEHKDDSFVRSIDADTLSFWEQTGRDRMTHGYIFQLERRD